MGEGEPPPTEAAKPPGKLTPVVEKVKGILGAPKRKVEAAQVTNFQEMLAAIQKHGSLEAAQKAEPTLFAKGGALSILAGHPGKAPK